MSSGERPVGAAKGKQPDTEALCQTPRPLALGCLPTEGGYLECLKMLHEARNPRPYPCTLCCNQRPQEV